MANDDKSTVKHEPLKAELQEQLEEAGLPSDGTKAELEERVADISKVHVPDTYVAQIKPKG